MDFIDRIVIQTVIIYRILRSVIVVVMEKVISTQKTHIYTKCIRYACNEEVIW